MFVLLLTACASVAVAEPSEYEYGDWGDLAERIQVLDDEGGLIDTQPIITVPEEAIEPEAPIQDEASEEEPPATLGLVPFLVYMHLKAEKRQDKADALHIQMVKGWETQLHDLIEKYEARETEIRSRYDKVIEKYNEERDKLFIEIDRKLDDVIRFSGSRNG